MIITRTPFRLSFFGGGTDYPGWYKINGGSVIATAIDKYCYISVRKLPPFFDHRIRIVYSRNEVCREIDQIQHPSVRETLRFMGIKNGIEIHHDGDLPARSGMGSSSAFTVGLLNSLHALKGKMVGPAQLGSESIYLEQEILRETVGSQDQVTAAHGGFNHIRFMPSGDIQVIPITISKERVSNLQDSLMLFYTGLKRTASEIAGTYVPSISEKERQLTTIGNMVQKALDILNSDRNLSSFGHLMNEAWWIKRSLSSSVSSKEIDSIYGIAMEAGAFGGKITGAGGGGFLLLFVPPERRRKVRESLRNLIHVPFQFEDSGSRVIFYGQQSDYSDAAEDNYNRDIRLSRESVGETLKPGGNDMDSEKWGMER